MFQGNSGGDLGAASEENKGKSKNIIFWGGQPEPAPGPAWLSWKPGTELFRLLETLYVARRGPSDCASAIRAGGTGGPSRGKVQDRPSNRESERLVIAISRSSHS